jgi:hypothetical protein
MMWVGAIVILVGAIVVYNSAQRMYRRYPAILALHEWIFWSIFGTWLVVPILVVVHVPLALLLLLIAPGLVIAVYAAFIKFPPIIESANVEIRRRRYVPPPARGQRPQPDAAAGWTQMGREDPPIPGSLSSSNSRNRSQSRTDVRLSSTSFPSLPAVRFTSPERLLVCSNVARVGAKRSRCRCRARRS